MKRAKLILLALALPFVMVPTVRANDGHEGEKGKHEKHDNDRHDKEGRDGEGHDRNNNDDHHDGDGKTSQGTRVPINAGIGILLVAGLGLGAKFMIDRNKKKATTI